MTAPLPHMEYPEERRLATILFASVQGLTLLAERLDFALITNLIKNLWDLIDKIIETRDGRVGSHLGDTVMAFWGAPYRGESDAETAVRTAIELRDSFTNFVCESEVPGASDLTLRISIHSGWVLAGYLGRHGEYTVMGDVVNTACLLQQTAGRGAILITDATHRLVRGVFQVHRIQAPLKLRCGEETMLAFLVDGLAMQSSKARYQSEGSLETYMVGREIELDRIFDQYQLAVNDSRPGLVLVTGESGIGKSRLLMEFTSQMEITDSPATIISIRALTQTRQVPYYLWKAIWSIHFRLRENASPNENRDHFLREIQKVWGFQLGPASSVEAAHLIGSLVGLPFEDSPFLREYDGEPESRMRRSYELTRELLRRMTSISPLILLLDDLQFADNGSLELILSLLEPSSDPLPLLILCGARSEFAQQHPQWLNASHIVDLGPLNVNADTVSQAYPSLAAYPEAARQEIAERSDGNPYFLEELAKSLLNSGIPPDGIAECELLEKIRALPLVSLRIMLQARLDNLSAEAKSVLMLASVVGRVFWVGAVYAAAQAGGNIVTNGLSASGEVLDRLVQDALRQLIRSELAFPLANTTFSDRQEYIFKHALLREVAYSLIPQQHKLRYHQSIGHWLTQQNQPDFNLMAADHYELGEDYEQAAHLYEMAAEQTLRQGAAREAQELIKKAKTLREPRKVIQ